MGKFSSKPKLPPRVELAPAVDAAASKRSSDAGADEAARRLRLSEKRKRGRRASILTNISAEEADSATIGRPAGRQSAVLFGS